MKILVFLGFLITANVEPTFAQQTETDSVTVSLEVVVPESTPDNATIFWTGSLNSWDPGDEGRGFSAKDFVKPTTFKNGIWTLKLKAPKNSKETYKYTRGSHFSVEEKSDYTYKQQRTIVFDKTKTVQDTVEAWHDIPPKELEENWPKLDLKETDINISYEGKTMHGMGTILYDEVLGSRFYDFGKLNTEVKDIPENFYDAVYYYQKVSASTDDLQLIAAGKTRPEGPWHIYVDVNNDKIIRNSEQIYTLQDDKKQEWSGWIEYPKRKNGTIITDSVRLTIRTATDLPPGYRSSANPDAPNLTYELPYKHREGQLAGQKFYITTPFQITFREHHKLTIDHNRNDTLEIGSGSNEVYEITPGRMHRQKKYYLFPSFKLGSQFWEVVNIDPHGDWIRLRPSMNYRSQTKIAKGEAAPPWKAKTIDQEILSSKSLQGKYVLLNFWGSWCGPCIEEIPLLKKAYQHFKSDNFEIVGFAYENQASLNEALKEYRLPWPQILDNKGAYSSKFLVRGYPTHYLIGPNGIILETDQSLSGERLIPTLEKYLD